MKKAKYRAYGAKWHQGPVHIAQLLARPIVLFVWGLVLSGCSDFVEVDPPKNTLVSETVFHDPATVDAALANLFYGLREHGMVSGTYGMTTVMGIYGDELDYYGSNADYMQLYHHNVRANNSIVLDWWRQAYSLIYGANDILKGVEASGELDQDSKDRIRGQALFIRAYLHSLLVSLYGDIPYITTTDYETNNRVAREPESEIYDKIISDLEKANELLEKGAVSDFRIRPDHYTAKALLARMYLYDGNYEMAASMAAKVIDAFRLEPDLDRVFLKDSPETIWQLKADETFSRNTKEAEQLIIHTVPGQTYALSDQLLSAFPPGDQRLGHWVNSISDSEHTITLSYPYKYKADINVSESLEYSILFRLAEQYFIRSEARAQLGDIAGAREDLNTIRNRAGLPDTTADDRASLMDALVLERRLELFTEQGQRWEDLKRTGRAGEALSALKPGWEPTDSVLPIPETELETNPHLLPQNTGY